MSNVRALVQVRILTPADAPAFQALRLRGLQECPSAFASSYEEERGTPVAVVAERLATQEDRATFGAFQEQHLIGVVGLEREQLSKLAHKAYIWGMYVEPTVRNRGVGHQLVAQALSYAANDLRVRQVCLGVNAQNVAAIALYKRSGFAQFGLEPGFMLLNGELHDEMHMVCLLQRAP
jgi:RimJ/RimL family protein N-acetyltransferase